MATKIDHVNVPKNNNTIQTCVLSVFSKTGQHKLCETYLLKHILSNKQYPDSTHPALTSLSPLTTPTNPIKDPPNLDTLSCHLCDVIFSSREEMLEHYRDDWHRYNLRLQLAGKKAVGEQEFGLLLSQDISSISGSDTSDDDVNRNTLTRTPPRLMLYCNIDNTVCSIFRELVHHPANTPDTLNQLLRNVSLIPERSRVAVLMQSAGHFAGAVFHGETIICHKSFHRYVVRAKGGTLQSVHDNSNFARSVGAQLRRAGEAALYHDIQELLRTWSDKLSVCDVIFLRIPAYNKQLFYAEGENFGFVKEDPRVRPVPVNTKRPTFTEVKRIHALMTSIFVHGNLEDFTTEEDDVIGSDRVGANFPNRDAMQDWFQALETEVVGRDTGKEDESAKKPKRSRRAKKNNKPSIESSDPKEAYFHQLMDACGKCDTPKVLSLLSEIGEPISFPVSNESADVIADATADVIADGSVEILEPAVELGSDEDWVLIEDPIEAVIEDTNLVEDLTIQETTQTEDSPNTLSDSVEICQSAEKTAVTSMVWEDLSDTEKRSVLQMTNAEGYTPLHLAAYKGFSPLIFHFLRYGADPTLKDKLGKVPYETSRDKPSRDAFRRFMFSFPTAYNYSVAKISSPLSPEMEEEQRKRKVEKKKSKSSGKKQKNGKKSEDEEVCKVLSKKEKRALEIEKQFLLSTVPTSGEKCAHCKQNLERDKFFEKYTYLYCSMHCLKKHRAAM